MKRLYASEIMGCANDICTDKTGTLTQNKMTVMALWTKDRIAFNEAMEDSVDSQLLAESVLYNSSAFIETEENGTKLTKGNVTEVGIINHLIRSNVKAEELLKNKDAEGFAEFYIPFSSLRKRATAVVRNPRVGGVTVFTKGAPEIVMEYCDSYIDAAGRKQELTEEKKAEIIKSVIKVFAGKCYRTILTAYAHYSES